MDHLTPAFYADNPWYSYQQWGSHNSPIVRAAFSVACDAYAQPGLERHKKKGDIPGLSHPSLAALLMEGLGRADELSLAITLLHDVMEDSDIFKRRDGKLYEELRQKLLDNDFDRNGADNIAYYIADHCRELRNDTEIDESKRTFKVMHAHSMSDRSKFIKILDQTASVIDDIFYESSWSRAKVERTAMKSMSVVKAAARGGTPEVLLAEKLFNSCFAYLQKIHRESDPEKVQALREGFDPARVMELLKRTTPEPPRDEKQEVIMHPDCAYDAIHPMPQSGVVMTYVTKDAKDNPVVSGYDILVDRGKGDDTVPNRVAIYLLGSIEWFAPKKDQEIDTEYARHVYLGQASVCNKQLVRHFDIVPPMEYREFKLSVTKANELLQGYSETKSADYLTPYGTSPVMDARMAEEVRQATARSSKKETGKS